MPGKKTKETPRVQIGTPKEITIQGAMFQGALTWGQLKKFTVEEEALDTIAEATAKPREQLAFAEKVVNFAVTAWKNEGDDEWQDWTPELIDNMSASMVGDLLSELMSGKERAPEN